MSLNVKILLAFAAVSIIVLIAPLLGAVIDYSIDSYIRNNIDVPLNLQPHNYHEVEALAGTLARQAECGNLEEMMQRETEVYFNCQKGTPLAMSFFTIEIFYDLKAKKEEIQFLNQIEKQAYKVGEFYIIRAKKAEELKSFSGELIIIPNK
jgi:hypothetical protein